MIDWSKPVRTVDGKKEIKVLQMREDLHFPVVGYLPSEIPEDLDENKNLALHCWTLEGVSSGATCYRAENVPAKIKGFLIVFTVYNGFSTLFVQDGELANIYATRENVIATLPLEFEKKINIF